MIMTCISACQKSALFGTDFDDIECDHFEERAMIELHTFSLGMLFADILINNVDTSLC